MDILARSTVWTFWLGVAVAMLAVVAILVIAVSYFVKVVRPQYPPRGAVRKS